MEFTKELISDIICERTSYCYPVIYGGDQATTIKSVDVVLNEAELLLSNGLSVSIHILLGHTNCNSVEPTACKSACSIEVWTLQITSSSMEEMVNFVNN